MKIIDNKIVEATESELYEYWLKRYDDVFSFTEFKERLIKLGVNITD